VEVRQVSGGPWADAYHGHVFKQNPTKVKRARRNSGTGKKRTRKTVGKTRRTATRRKRTSTRTPFNKPMKVYSISVPPTSHTGGYQLTVRATTQKVARNTVRDRIAHTPEWKATGKPIAAFKLPGGVKITEVHA
jgi:hypothetical protein